MMVFSALRRVSFGLVVLLAVLLLFGSEVLAWTNPPQRPLLEWLLLLPGYLALSAVLLDLIVRYRIRDLFGGLLLAGIYSLLAALALNPAAMLNDLPRTLFTRVMGAHALLAAEMIGLFLLLTGGGGSRRNLLIGCAVVGLAWGIWAKNWPITEGFGAVSLPTMLAFGSGGIVLIILLLYGMLPRMGTAPTSEFGEPLDALRLTPRGWTIVIFVLSALITIRWRSGEIAVAGLVICPLLLVLCWGIIWFRGRKRGETLLDDRLPPRPLPLLDLLLAVLIFMGIGIVGYNLPDIKMGTITPQTLIGLGFTAYGLAWLPTVSLVLGVQGYLRQLATRKL